MRREHAIYQRKTVEVEGGKFVTKTGRVEVRVMARAEGYEMVRRKGAGPFVVSEKDLEPMVNDGK